MALHAQEQHQGEDDPGQLRCCGSVMNALCCSAPLGTNKPQLHFQSRTRCKHAALVVSWGRDGIGAARMVGLAALQ